MKMLKIVFYGASCGKTTLINRYLTGQYTDSTATVGATQHLKTVKNKGQDTRLDIFDTAGQERFKAMLPETFEDADVVVFCFKIDEDPNVVKENFKGWEGLIPKTAKRVIVATAFDLYDENKQTLMDPEDSFKLFKEQNANLYCECSAKTGAGLEELFNAIIELVPNPQKQFNPYWNAQNNNNANTNTNTNTNEKNNNENCSII